MFGRQLTLFRLFNFKVKVDASWLFIAALVTWTLARGFFPNQYRGLSDTAYWIMGVAGAIGLFLSIILHEFSHSIVANKFGLPIRGITLFVFGGVAEMEEEPSSAKAEFFMAFVGPLTSIALGFIFYGMFNLGLRLNWSLSAIGVLDYLKWINWVLAAFNMVPAFPLDGGRILRSILWQWKKNLRWATRIASNLGSAFGFFLSAAGIFYIFSGAFIAGMWYFLIGMFLRGASQMSYQRLLMRKALEGEKVSDFMKTDPIVIPPSISIAELVEDYIYKYHFKMFPVVKDGRLAGCVSTREVKEVPREQWKSKKVEDVLISCSVENTLTPDTDAVRALSIMSRKGKSRIMVVEGERLVGIITLKDLLQFFSLKLDLEGEAFSLL
jgi:Zn-dependent protease/CBS domain-containing protein